MKARPCARAVWLTTVSTESTGWRVVTPADTAIVGAVLPELMVKFAFDTSK